MSLWLVIDNVILIDVYLSPRDSISIKKNREMFAYPSYEQPCSQGLSFLPSLSLREAEKRDPGNKFGLRTYSCFH